MSAAGEAGVEAPVGLHVGPEPHRSPCATTSTTPPRVSPSSFAASTSATIRAVDASSTARVGEASMRSASPGIGIDVGRRVGGAERDHVREHLDPEGLREERLRDGPERHLRGGLPRGGPLEHRARLLEAVLRHAREVGVAGPRAGQRRVAGAPLEQGRVDRVGGHHRLPLGPLAVADAHRHRAALGQPVADATEDLQLVGLEAHPRAPAVAQTPPGQLGRDLLRGHLDPGHQALEDRHQRRTVRLACRQPPQHHPAIVPRPPHGLHLRRISLPARRTIHVTPSSGGPSGRARRRRSAAPTARTTAAPTGTTATDHQPTAASGAPSAAASFASPPPRLRGASDGEQDVRGPEHQRPEHAREDRVGPAGQQQRPAERHGREGHDVGQPGGREVGRGPGHREHRGPQQQRHPRRGHRPHHGGGGHHAPRGGERRARTTRAAGAPRGAPVRARGGRPRPRRPRRAGARARRARRRAAGPRRRGWVPGRAPVTRAPARPVDNPAARCRWGDAVTGVRRTDARSRSPGPAPGASPGGVPASP